MEFLRTLLLPLSKALQFLLEAIYGYTGSYGLSIVILAVLVSFLLSPVTAFARKLEAKDQARQKAMKLLVADAKKKFSGREQFEAIDQIYQRHGYHPIQSMGAVLPLFIQLPFLLAALFLLTRDLALAGQGFLFIRDLGAPDGLLSLGSVSVNLLPIAMTAITVAESQIRPEATASSRAQFLIVAAVLLVLIYGFASAVCLYWLTSNAVSLTRSFLRGRALLKRPVAHG
ncbi:MAG: membrane protein insertase YidC [Pseudomonadota bacterium]